jgi:hypothetical protein
MRTMKMMKMMKNQMMIELDPITRRTSTTSHGLVVLRAAAPLHVA